VVGCEPQGPTEDHARAAEPQATGATHEDPLVVEATPLLARQFVLRRFPTPNRGSTAAVIACAPLQEEGSLTAAKGTNPRRRAWLGHAAVLTLYVGVALLALRNGLGGSRVVGQGVDLSGTLWYFEWIRHCLIEGVNPGFSDWFFHPTGKDIFAHTGSNFVDAVLAQPVRALLGFPGYYTPFLALLLVGNALSMQRLLRGRGVGWPAVVAVALLFELHPYTLHELSQGRPTQALLLWLPLALHHLLAFSDRGRWRDAVLAGVFFALQGWTYWFMGHFVLLMIGPVCLALLWRAPDRARMARGLALMVAVTVLLVLPALVPMALHAAGGQVPGLDQAAFGDADTTQFDPRIAFGTRWLGGAGGHGLPVPQRLLLLLLASLLLARNRLLWIPGILVGALVMVGPVFVMGDAQLTNPLWSACDALLPFFERLWFPYRGWGVLAVLWSLPLAESIGRLRLGIPALLRLPLLVMLGLLFSALPETLMRPISVIEIPRPTYVDAIADAPGLVLDLPFLCSEEAIHLQPLHGSPLVGGMAEGTPAFRPDDLRDRVYDVPLLAAVATASLSGRAPHEAPPGGPGQVRWVVFQKPLYRSVVIVRQCWEGPQLERDARIALVRQALVTLLGPPTVEDDEAAAWDLQRLR
jgi:hypothetical protein